jgi:hypothetical protein
VVAHLGPGAPRDVLATLLNGSSFNYVMLGTSTDSTAVASVILMSRASATGDVPAGANGNPEAPGTRFPPHPFNQQVMGQGGQPVNGQVVEAEENAEDADNAEDNADEQNPPGQPAASAPEQQPQQPDPNQPNAGPRTPEQILEMLQRQRQQPGAVPPPQQ